MQMKSLSTETHLPYNPTGATSLSFQNHVAIVATENDVVLIIGDGVNMVILSTCIYLVTLFCRICGSSLLF